MALAAYPPQKYMTTNRHEREVLYLNEFEPPLRPEFLDKVMQDIVSNESQGMIVKQLRSPLNIANQGLVLHNSSKEDDQTASSTLSADLFKIWEVLADERSLIVMQDWIFRQMSDVNKRSECVALLTTLSNFSLLLPQRIRSYTFESNDPQVNQVAARNLYNSLSYAQLILAYQEADLNQITSLQAACEELALTQDFIFEETDLQASKLNQAARLITDFSRASELAANKQGAAIVNYIGILGITNIPALLELVETKHQLPKEVINAIQTHALRVNLIEGSKEQIHELREETTKVLKNGRFVDAAEIDYSQIIPQGTHTIRIWEGTGTFLADIGHAEFFRKIDTLIDTKGKAGVFDLILVLPNLIPGIAQDGTAKPIAYSGNVDERTALLATHLAGIDSNRIVMTTTWQPRPDESLRGRYRLEAAYNHMTKKIVDDTESDINFKRIRWIGADELTWEGENGHLRLSDTQSSKFAGDTVVIATGAYVPRCLRYSKQILEQLGESCTLIIAADPVAMTRSSDAIGAFRKRGSLKGFTPAAWPIVTKSFSDERITERMRQDPGQTTYPSVTEAVQKAITIIHDSLVVQS